MNSNGLVPNGAVRSASRHKKAPHVARLSLLRRIAYLLRPEPGPVGVSVDPLGEDPAPMVLPDGFRVVLEPGAVERDMAPAPAALPVVVPVVDGLVTAPPLVAPPAAEPAPVEPTPLCASANEPDIARAVASAIVEIFMVGSFPKMPMNKSQRGFTFPSTASAGPSLKGA
jgi:hypothetical protein